MKTKNTIFLHLFLLAILFAVSFSARYFLYQKINSVRGGQQFLRESALFAYFADKAVSGGSLSSEDPMIRNAGEGVVPDRVFSLFFLKRLVGLYMAMPYQGQASLEAFLASSGQLAFSLMPVIVYLIILRLTESAWGAFGGGLFSSLSAMAMLRTLAVDYTKEIYALPVMALRLLFAVMVLTTENKRTRILYAVFAGLAIGLGNLIWDMTRLYLAVTSAAFLVVYLWTRRSGVWLLLISQLSIPLALSFTDPFLVFHRYWAYPLNALIPALFCMAFFESRKWMGRAVGITLFFSVLFACILTLMQYNTDYSHFWDLFFYKVRFLNRKPIDSAKIPYEVRLLWTPALHSLDARSFIAYYLGVLTVAAPGFFLAGKRAGRHIAVALTITGASFFLLSIFFFRLIVFNAFILPIGIGFTACAAAQLKHAWSRVLAAAVVLGVFTGELNNVFSAQGLKKYTENFPYRETRSLTRWMKLVTPQGSVFLANFTLTPSLLYYGKRAIATHPQYEDAASRGIIRDYIESLFGENEETFYRFCLSNQVDYFVFSRGTYNDTSKDSFLYIAGRDRIEEEAARTVAFRFERDMTRLAYFGLCYEDAKYCVFRVITPAGMEESSRLFRQARDAFRINDNSPEGLVLLYRAFLENPQNIAVRLMMNARQKQMKSRINLPHGY